MITATGVGRLTRDPDTRYTPSGKTVTTMRVASDGRTKDADPTYIDIEVWEGLAETCAKYLRKGRQIHFAGSLRLDQWETDSGKRSRHKINAHQIEFLAAPKSSNGSELADDFEPVAQTGDDADIP